MNIMRRLVGMGSQGGGGGNSDAPMSPGGRPHSNSVGSDVDTRHCPIISSGSSGGRSRSSSSSSASNPQPDQALGLMHLRKLFADLSRPTSTGSQSGTGVHAKDVEERLYQMLPLFCKVFGNAPADDMTEKFGDILQFCSLVSRLMVSEIRRRASNQSTEAASRAIAEFLEIENREEDSHGWMLLSTLNLLSAGTPALIDCMTAASLPSTLVKCLYLFFDLPPDSSVTPATSNQTTADPPIQMTDNNRVQQNQTSAGRLDNRSNSVVSKTEPEFSQLERKILLQKVFEQVLTRLCGHIAPAEELSRKDDLVLLFSAVTSWCPIHNAVWRRTAGEVLMTISRSSLTPTVIRYLHEKGCIAMCVENLQRSSPLGGSSLPISVQHSNGALQRRSSSGEGGTTIELRPSEIVEMLVTLFCILKDSADVSPTLMEDFRTCQGYNFLSELMLRMEDLATADSQEVRQQLRHLVLPITSLALCGYKELRPPSAVGTGLFQMPGFSIPEPQGRGASVRNLAAFSVLQTVFLKGRSDLLCSTVLDAVVSVYHADPVNYFVLEDNHTLSQFAERVPTLSTEIQGKFFETLVYVVIELNFVPCKELISLSLLLQQQQSLECSILCLHALLRILRHHSVFRDVFREVGLLEVLVTCLHRYAALLKDPESANDDDDSKDDIESDDDSRCMIGSSSKRSSKVPEAQQELGFLVMEALALTLQGNSANASVFRECGGARCAHNMVPYRECRQMALAIVQQLVLSPGGDDDMGTLLGLMHTAPAVALDLKAHILKALLAVLRESHRTRTVFRKVGGFVYVMTVLVSMEGCLAIPPNSPWEEVDRKDVLSLLKTIFNTLTVAMRYEPANAKFFSAEVRFESLTEAIRLLGCFTTETKLSSHPPGCSHAVAATFEDFFWSGCKDSRLSKDVPRELALGANCIRYLYDMALDAFDRPALHCSSGPGGGISNPQNTLLQSLTVNHRYSHHHLSSQLSTPLPQTGNVLPSSNSSTRESTPISSPNHGNTSSVNKRASTGSIGQLIANNSSHSNTEPAIVHPGAVVSILRLLPAVFNGVVATKDGKSLPPDANNDAAVKARNYLIDLQLHIAELLRSLLRSERNQQCMCDAGFASELLSCCSKALEDESHPLHPPVQSMFERLAAQALEPRDLRAFLRLGNPLCCSALDQHFDAPKEENDKKMTNDLSPVASGGSPVTLSRVKCLVSMTTPRDPRLHGVAIMPAFVEFDMSAEGFGALFLPSITPQAPGSGSGPSSVGGLGVGGMVGGMVGAASDGSVVGGIGSGERVFPPPNSLSFSTWMCVDRFSNPLEDGHPIRLLALVRVVTPTAPGTPECSSPGASGDTPLGASPTESPESHLICLTVELGYRDRSLLVSTVERTFEYLVAADQPPGPSSSTVSAVDVAAELEPPLGESTARFWCPELTQEGQWHHLALVLNRATFKNSTVSVFVDGQHMHTQKLHYIAAYPGGATASPGSPVSVYGYIGTPPQLRRNSKLVWRQGPAHLFEEVLSPATIAMIFRLGPNYVGSFQAPPPGDSSLTEANVPQVNEERVVFGIHAHALSNLTLARIRKFYNKLDAKAIARQLGMSSHESSTPIRVLHNTAGHLMGPARALGAVIMGYQGVRTFCPQPVAKCLEHVGGPSTLLGLVAMATDVEGLYAAVKALVCACRSNKALAQEMDRVRGYQTLAMLLKKKRHLLNAHILHLTFALVGTVGDQLPRGAGYGGVGACGGGSGGGYADYYALIPNRSAFADLLCDLEVWAEAPGDLLRSLFEHFCELLAETVTTPSPSSPTESLRSAHTLLRDLQLAEKILHALKAPGTTGAGLSVSTTQAAVAVLSALLQGAPDAVALNKIGQFVTWTLPPPNVSEQTSDSFVAGLDALNAPKRTRFNLPQLPVMESSLTESDGGNNSNRNIKTRNLILENLLQLLRSPSKTVHRGISVSTSQVPSTDALGCPLAEEIQRVLGFDWLLSLMQSHLDEETVLLANSILLHLIASSTAYMRFRDGTHVAGWLEGTDLVAQNRQQLGVLIGSNTHNSSNIESSNPTYSTQISSSGNQQREVSVDSVKVPGFTVLSWMLPRHAHVAELYYLYMAALLGQPIKTPPRDARLDIDAIWSYIFGVPAGQSVVPAVQKGDLSVEAAVVVLTMVRALLNTNVTDEDAGCWQKDYPVTVLQFLLFLYHNQPDLAPLCATPEFLSALAATIFTYKTSSDPNSDVGTPVEEIKTFGTPDDAIVILNKPSGTKNLPGAASSGSESSSLTSHPARRLVMDFLKLIIVDNLSLPAHGAVNKGGCPVLDALLDAAPDYASQAQQREFQTDLLRSLMNHLLAADALLGDQGALPVVEGGSQQSLTLNVFYVAQRVVDKLWQGVFLGESKEVFDFISRLIAQAKRRAMLQEHLEIADITDRKSHVVWKEQMYRLIFQATGLSLDPIYRSLNRTILFQLSRPAYTVPDQMNVLDSLHQLTHNRSLVFGPGNYESDFVGCLCHCLLQLTEDIESSQSKKRTTWHVETPVISVAMSEIDVEKSPVQGRPTSTTDVPPNLLEVKTESGEKAGPEGLQLLANAAKRVWEELVNCKRQTIEEVFKVTLTPATLEGCSVVSGHSSDLKTVRPLIQEAANRVWQSYVSSERRTCQRDAEKANQMLTSRLMRVGSGLSKLTTRKKSHAPSAAGAKNILPTFQEYVLWTYSHASIVRELVSMQYKQFRQAQLHLQNIVYDEWMETEIELTRERGLWGPSAGSRLDKWKLDMTEGPCRMRKKMTRNDMFYINYPWRPELELGNPNDAVQDARNQNMKAKYRVAISMDSKDHYQRYRARSLVDSSDSGFVSSLGSTGHSIVPEMPDHVEVENIQPQDIRDAVLKGVTLLPRPRSQRSLIDPDEDDTHQPVLPETSSVASESVHGDEVPSLTSATPSTPAPSGVSTGAKSDVNQIIWRLLEEGEKIRHMFRCARIQGLDTHEGLLLFGKEHYYVIDGFTLLKTKEICDIDALPPGVHDPIIPNPNATPQATRKVCSKFSYENIREVLKRRYLLQPNALEVFSADGRNYLLAFPRKIRNRVHQKFLSVATSITDSAADSVAGQKRNADVEAGTGILGSLMGERSVTQRWEKGEITNFQYLMHLNTLAGRSYNDLMQYPVFPWIIADYDGQDLDLYSASTFRDLSKPMGALHPDRLEQYKKRHREWDDPTGETPPYHYGTHYSSAMIVASYLVRMEPFTQLFLKLQGGHFDLADRMFHSIRETWLSAAKNNMADVKELIPEFYYLPEFLKNSNKFDLGVKQSGVALDDVVLPPWAKGDPREFVRAHREALECDFVSAHLNEWIDLIFGFKQQGQPAYEAVNVFHHLFYEGNVDIDSITDPLKKNATIGFINNFGQIPKQLFKKPHPAKRLSRSNFDYLGPLGVTPAIGSVAASAAAASQTAPTSTSTNAPPVTSFPVSAPPPAPVAPNNSQPAQTDKLFFHHCSVLQPTVQPVKELKGAAAVGSMVSTERGTLLAVEQNKCLIPPLFHRYVAWGFADLSLRVGDYHSDRTVPGMVYEMLSSGEVLCAACPTENILVTGGTSSVVHVWEFGGRSSSRDSSVSGSSDVRKSLAPKRPLYGHTEAVTCMAASALWHIIVSGSRDRTCILWDMNGLCFLRQLGPHSAPVAAVAINELTGDVCSCAGTYLHVWAGLSGELIASINTANSRSSQILCVAMSEMSEWDLRGGNTILTGSSDGVVRMWSLQFVQVPDEAAKEKPSAPVVDAEKDDKDVDNFNSHSTNFNENSSAAHSDGANGVSARRPSIDSDSSAESMEAKMTELIMADEAEEARETPEPSVKEIAAEDKVVVASDQPNPSPSANLPKEGGRDKSPPDPISTWSEDGCHVFVPNWGETSCTPSTLRSQLEAEGPGVAVDSPADSYPSTESFEILSVAEVNAAKKQERAATLSAKNIRSDGSFRRPSVKLRDGYKWRRQLTLRSKLTMHTAFDRKDNKNPAAVTAISISKDHKTVYVGDERGRIFSWSVPNNPGRTIADHWVRDEGADSCVSCGVRFSFSERRHHCRNCGLVFCRNCSRFESEISRLRIRKPVRVCQTCYTTLQSEGDTPSMKTGSSSPAPSGGKHTSQAANSETN